MAKKRKGESLSGYFKKVFEEHREWVEGSTNEAVLNQYREDHGLSADAEIKKNVKEAMSNAKSKVRKALGIATPGRGKRKGKKAKATNGAVAVAAKPSNKLQSLEERIDTCMAIAYNHDPEGLAEVIKHLRRARNGVVYLMGE